MHAIATIGHNQPTLEDRIFSDPSITAQDVLEAVGARLKQEHQDEINALTDRAKQLTANGSRLPETLTQEGAIAALELIHAIDQHEERVKTERDTLVATAKTFMDEMAGFCKPIDAGLAALTKKMRPLLEEFLFSRLDAHNAEREGTEELKTSITERGPSGSKATLVEGWENIVTDPNLIPRDLCVPDQKLIDKAIAEGREVPGTEKKRSGSLRVSK